MNSVIEQLQAQGIHPYASEQALRKEAHVARFLAREYQAALDNLMTLDELVISTSSGSMWEETESLMETHYDEKIEIFNSFLDSRYHAYSMAFYGDEQEDVMERKMSLEDAQENKFQLICDRIGIQGHERILNIGCGFGSFERYLLKRYPGVQITGITPSTVQIDYIRSCASDPGCLFYERGFTVIKKDFSALSGEDIVPGSFDLICSIGLLEQVKNMDGLNEKISYYLKPGGKAFHHFIVSKITIPQFLDAGQTLIKHYFPGGRIWPLHEFGRHTKDLDLEQMWFINGMNYWRTLDEWHRRFWTQVETLHNHLDIDRIHFWNEYFILCKACFLPMQGTLFGNGHYLFRKPL
jgi:cyclopropane-fatty-acyl-phospholipid synthase